MDCPHGTSTDGSAKKFARFPTVRLNHGIVRRDFNVFEITANWRMFSMTAILFQIIGSRNIVSWPCRCRGPIVQQHTAGVDPVPSSLAADVPRTATVSIEVVKYYAISGKSASEEARGCRLKVGVICAPWWRVLALLLGQITLLESQLSGFDRPTKLLCTSWRNVVRRTRIKP